MKSFNFNSFTNRYHIQLVKMEVNNNEYHMLEHKTSGLLIILDWVGLFVGEVELEKSFVETQGSFSSSNKLAFLQWGFFCLTM